MSLPLVQNFLPAMTILFAVLLLLSLSSASPTGAPAPQSTKCGEIVNSGNSTFRASDALACLTSVPFNPAVASRFLKYYNDTLQFQSTVKTLKNPPSSYQQPAIDVVASFNRIQRDIDDGNFKNFYAFETALQKVVHAIHDSHVSLVVGVSAAFSFGSAYSIISISRDGVEMPKVYFTGEVLAMQKRGPNALPPAITKINGIDATDYLTQLAADNSYGLVEPHADWNQLMACPAAEIQDYYTIFEASTTFFPGESLTFTFEDGHTADPVPWLAFYYSPGDTGPIATGGDFFNFFVLGLYPASYEPPRLVKNALDELSPPIVKSRDTPGRRSPTARAAPQGWGNPAYPPNPDIVQGELGASGSGGTITGYFLHEASVGVISIPSFYAYGEDVQSFSNKIGDFLRLSKQNGMARIVVDVQQNGGGIPLLAIDAFKQFFPSIDPFAGSRLRAHYPADVLGNTFEQYYDTQRMSASYSYALFTSEWVATDRLNAQSGQNFTSWGEFYGPREYNGDYFTSTQSYNLSSYIFDEVVSGGIIPHGYDPRIPPSTQYYEAKDIIVLSNGVCASACALFMEMMHHEAQVRTVVAGGRPTNGTMQAASGTRGARAYSSHNLDQDMRFAERINATTAGLLPDRFQNIWLTYAGVNLRDTVRKGQDVPLQFAYEAADCRIFYTPQTFYNYTTLWKYAANAAWTNPRLCVQGSTGYATTGDNVDTKGPPIQSINNGQSQNAPSNNSSVFQLSLSTDASNAPSSGVQYDTAVAVSSSAVGVDEICDAHGPRPCNNYALVCRAVPICKAGSSGTENRCVQRCWIGVPIKGLSHKCSINVACQYNEAIHQSDPASKCQEADASLYSTSGANSVQAPSIVLKTWCRGLCLPPSPPKDCSQSIYAQDPNLVNTQSSQMASSGGDVTRAGLVKKGSIGDMVRAGVAAWE